VGFARATESVVLEDFKRVQKEIEGTPDDATEVCAMQCLSRIFLLGEQAGTHFYHLFFDRNEPYYGHVVDRWRNKKARRVLTPFTKVVSCSEIDVRDTHANVSALQVADLFAWCVNHKDDVRCEWHRRLLKVYRVSEWLDYSVLRDPNCVPMDLRSLWRLPKHKPTR